MTRDQRNLRRLLNLVTWTFVIGIFVLVRVIDAPIPWIVLNSTN